MDLRSVLTRLFVIYTAGIIFIYSFLSFIIPPGMFSDSAWGFLTWQGMLDGAPFNSRYLVDPHNIAQNILSKCTWWSPGQYFVPGMLQVLCRLTLGQALTAVTALASVSGVLGLYQLYTYFGFSKFVSSASISMIAASRFFALPFGIYNGGEILLFGAFPWIVLTLIKHRDIKGRWFVAIAVLFLIGVFLKFTFVLCAAAMLGAVVLWKLLGDPTRSKLETTFFLGRVLILLAVLYLGLRFLTSGGGSIDKSGRGFHWDVHIFFYCLSLPIMSVMSLQALIFRLFLHPGHEIVNSLSNLWVFFALGSFFNVFILFEIARSQLNRFYRFFSVSFFIGFTGLMGSLYLMGNSVSYEERHFLWVGLILLPGMLHLAMYVFSVPLRSLIVLVMVLLSGYGMVSFFIRFQHDRQSHAVGRMGFTQMDKKGLLQALHQMDGSLPVKKNNVFYVTSPGLALEIEKNRVMSSHADFESISELAARRYHGHVDNLIIVMEKSFEKNGKQETILRSFSDYDYSSWRKIAVDGFNVFFQGDENLLRVTA